MMLYTSLLSFLYTLHSFYFPYISSQMRILAAYLLAVVGGNNTPSEKDIATILESVNIKAEDGRIASFLSEVKGKVCILQYPSQIAFLSRFSRLPRTS